MEKPDKDTDHQRGALRIMAGPAAVLAVLVVIGRIVGGAWPDIEAAVAEMGRTGWVVYVGTWTLLSCACFPASVLGFSAGLLFGFRLGFVLVLIGGFLGGTLMFGVTRGFLRERVRELVSGRPRLAAIDRLAARQDVKLNVLTRLSPLNFGLASYTLSAGKSRYGAYLAGLAATAPHSAAQVWFGTLAARAGNAAAERQEFPWARTLLLVAGVLFFAVLTWQVGRMVRRAWEDEEGGPDGAVDE